MAEKEMIISNYVTAFVDILGQTQKLLEYPILPLPDQIDESFQQWTRDTFGAVKQFREQFFDFFNSAKANAPKNEYAQKFKEQRIGIIPASDAIIIYSTLFESETYIPVLDIHNLIGSCALNFILFLYSGRLFRAAIDIGIGMESEELQFYGSSIAKAYCLESNINNPCIAVGSDLLDYLSEAKKIPDSGPKAKITKVFAQRILDELIVKENGQSYVNIFSDYFLALLEGTGADVNDWLKQIHEFIDRSLKEFENSSNIQSKYLYLKDKVPIKYK